MSSRRTPGRGRGPQGPQSGSVGGLTPEADAESVTRAIVLRQLTAAPRTRAQLTEALRRRGVPADAADAVLDRFEEVSLVDDGEFARQWVATRHAGRGLARRALRHELRERGVAEETVADAVDRLDPETERDAARRLVRRKLATMREDDPVRRARRLAGMLARKGYGQAVAFRVIREETADDAGAGGWEEEW